MSLEVLSAKAAAERLTELGCKKTLWGVYRLMDTGELESIRIGGRRYIPVTAIADLLSAGPRIIEKPAPTPKRRATLDRLKAGKLKT